MKALSILSTAAIVALLAGCLPTTQSTNSGGTAYNSAPNRYGYRGSVTDPSGFQSQPSAAPDGALAQAISPTSNSGVLNNQVTQSPPVQSMGNGLSGPVLPNVSSNPPRPPDTGTNPKVTNNQAPVPSAPAPTGSSKPNLGSSSAPTPPPTTSKPKEEFPFGIPVPGKEGMVYSPYDKEAGYVEVRGMKPGTLVEDPYTKKFFRVP